MQHDIIYRERLERCIRKEREQEKMRLRLRWQENNVSERASEVRNPSRGDLTKDYAADRLDIRYTRGTAAYKLIKQDSHTG